jgi:uncharacterized membrane protein YdbT with pleckstrin-like domain
MNSEFEKRDPSQPIAYDANGNPLYATPPQPSPSSEESSSPEVSSHVTAASSQQEGQSFDPRARVQYGNEPNVRHMTREIEPEKRPVSNKLQERHEQSKLQYPFLNLSEGEVVILNLQRHPIGLFLPLFAGGIVLAVLTAVLVLYPADAADYGLPGFGLASLILGLLMGLVGIGTYIAVWIYLQNQFFMTNESVIQEIQHSLFSRHEQTVSLGSIEDASFKKSGILQTILDYGTIRLSTEGEETTYQFPFVANPRRQVAILNNGVEAFKNGRPVELADPIVGN